MKAASFPLSTSPRLGPTVPLEPAGAKVWQFPHPWAAKTAFPASGDPDGGAAPVVVGAGGGGVGVVVVGPVSVVVSRAASPSCDSLANTSTAPSIAIVRITVTTMNNPSPRLPG